uniref:Nuclease HARBI1 n=1 Tax=Diabrotica virgifera virgifera TaxID=50390 RepID=A0A6P7GV57_DIAVI
MRRGEVDGEIVAFEKKVLFTIWMLSKPESFIAAGDRFNLAKSTSHEVFVSVVNLLVSVRMEYIQWPDHDERQRISRTLKAKSGIPGIVGAIDGCHIAIKASPRNANDYYNRNNYHYVILQAVCNDKKQFTDVFVGVPGRVHDARVFRNSIPGIVGAIDGCHIAIKAPRRNANDYYNRNNYHSVIPQAVCNDKKQFTHVFVGVPGRVHDARVFRNSHLHTLLTDDNPPIDENQHI